MSSKSEEIRIGQLAIRFLVEGQALGGSVAVFEFDVQARAKVPAAHSHDGYEETIYGLEGVVTFTVQDRPVEIGPADVLCILGAVHRFDNFHSNDAKALAIITPGILGNRTDSLDVAAVLKAAAGGPPDHAEIAAVMKRHGLTAAP